MCAFNHILYIKTKSTADLNLPHTIYALRHIIHLPQQFTVYVSVRSVYTFTVHDLYGQMVCDCLLLLECELEKLEFSCPCYD